MNTFPNYMVNQDFLIEAIKKEIEKNNALAHNIAILEILYELYTLNRDY